MFKGKETPKPPDWSKVDAHLFNENGKWKYHVRLDYTGLLSLGEPPDSRALDLKGVHWNGHEMARQALRQATEKGTSGVVIREIHWGWTLVVFEPPQGFPHLVHRAEIKE